MNEEKKGLSIPHRISVNKPNSLSARLASAKLSDEVLPKPELKFPNQMPNRLALLLDCSGSMDGEPITLLQQAAQDFISRADFTTTAIALESFPEGTRTNLAVDKLTLWTMAMGLSADGGTPMSQAMHYVVSNLDITRAILISDGQPDNVQVCYYSAENYKDHGITIDTVHIGLSASGEECLRRIAEITGGLFVKFQDVKKFSEAFKFLLPETRANAFGLLMAAGANEVK
jgi:uncharacterized protein YegL